ncbi:MAG: hypothetical protein HRU40_19890 [Saprospiraceae bacterium]|nr:hypothetical protein [Saprospiraceae bacterium]
MKESYRIENEFSILYSFLWMLFLALGIQAILGLMAAVGFGALGVPDDEIEFVFMRPDAIAIIGVIAAILSVPLIKVAAHQSGKSFPFDFLAIKSINGATLSKVFLVGIGYYIFFYFYT